MTYLPKVLRRAQKPTVNPFQDHIGHCGAPRRPFRILQAVHGCRWWASAPRAARLVLNTPLTLTPTHLFTVILVCSLFQLLEFVAMPIMTRLQGCNCRIYSCPPRSNAAHSFSHVFLKRIHGSKHTGSALTLTDFTGNAHYFLWNQHVLNTNLELQYWDVR